jgi:hypothetical protein
MAAVRATYNKYININDGWMRSTSSTANQVENWAKIGHCQGNESDGEGHARADEDSLPAKVWRKMKN